MDWTRAKIIIGCCGAGMAEALTAALGGWDMWLKALVIFVVLDYLSGILAAIVEQKVNSEIGYKGVIKKVFIFVLVAVAQVADVVMGTDVIRVAVVGFYIGVEGMSILENAGRSGLPLPEELKNTLTLLRGQGENE